MKLLRLLFLIIVVNQLAIIDCSAKITINSVHVTPSTCPNNGTATVFASSTSDTAVFLYNITAGPVTYPLQNDSIFKSLYPGTYTVWVHDINSYDSTKTTFTITGSYVSLATNPVVEAPLCITGKQGAIIANPNGTGLGPYTYQVISPYTGTPQNSDTLSNLAPGVYVVKVTDACFNAVTAGAVIDSSELGFQLTYIGAGFLSCGTASLQLGIIINSGLANYPLKITYTTKSGTEVHSKIPGKPTLGQYFINDTIHNVGFDQYLRICFTDTCHNTYCLTRDTLFPFKFDAQQYQLSSNCAAGYGASFQFDVSSLGDTSMILDGPNELPLTVTLTDSSTHLVVDSFVSVCCGSLIPLQTGGHIYIMKVKDQCGDAYSTPVLWSSPPPANFSAADYYKGGCIDSTGSVDFAWSGMGSGLTISILSGPALARSTKPGFAYSNTLTYPITFTGVPNNGNYYVSELPAGTYTYQAHDSCGNTFTGTFKIYEVSSLEANYTYSTTCSGLNTINVAFGNGLTAWDIQMFSPNKNANVGGSAVGSYSFQNFPLGNYTTITTYNNYPGTVPVPGLPACAVVNGKLDIVAVNDSILTATDVATCNGVIFVRLDADSNNGKLPFQYEIINGPQTFPPQNSNIFTVNTFGTYVVGVIDSCGNVDARQISIDTGRFTPVVRSGGWCPGTQVQLTETYSPYYSYVWRKPDGSIFTGDTLVINPFTHADTGMYYISKIVTINGCTDSAFGKYHLVFQDTFHQNISLCAGDTLFVGAAYHFLPGIYVDSMTGAYGCDSIEITNLSLNSTGTVNISPASPPPCHNGSTTLTATGGTKYIWHPGNYTTNSITVSPAEVTVYTVFADENLTCSATATVTVYPAGDTTINITTNKTIFCASDSAQLCAPAGFTSYQWSGGITDTGNCVYVHQAGDYYVTGNDGGTCTISSKHLQVNVYPVPSVSIIVLGDTLFTYGQIGYQWLFNNNIIPGATGTVYVAPQHGLYSLEVTDSNGCTTISNPVNVTTVRNLAEEQNISIYPNPSTGSWQLAVDNDLVGAKLEVFDEQARLVMKDEVRTTKYEITAGSLSSGVYYLRINNDKVSVVRKLVKM